jgi:DNA repair photolyase
MENKPFHGKCIYNPSGKAGEYSYWAANFYNGCSAKCEYCYNRHGRSAKLFGADVPTLKKCLVNRPGLTNERNAFNIFCKEVEKNIDELRKHGLFFNFVSDPFLPETIYLNSLAIKLCVGSKIPVKVLTKQTWWVDGFIVAPFLKTAPIFFGSLQKDFISFGFTLTGHDELEPGAATNAKRIEAMEKLHNAGFKTWASIEPVVSVVRSILMIARTKGYCDLFKIGLQSGKKYDKKELINMINWCIDFIGNSGKLYFKDSLLKQAGINRADLPSNCVTHNFN